MELMNRWTTQVENVQHLPLLNVTLLVSEVSSQPVALDSFGCFFVNFSLVGSVSTVEDMRRQMLRLQAWLKFYMYCNLQFGSQIISVIFTYALVKAQFHTTRS